MAEIVEIKIQTQGYPGAPGWTTLHFRPADIGTVQGCFVVARAFLIGISQIEPPEWSGTVLADAGIFNEATGLLVRYEAADAGITDPVAGIGATGFGAGVAGVCFAWSTSTVKGTRRVRGRTFVVPVQRGTFAPDGTLDTVTLASLQDVIADMVNSGVDFGVWSRPGTGQSDGVFAPVLSGRINDRAAFLSSRRS